MFYCWCVSRPRHREKELSVWTVRRLRPRCGGETLQDNQSATPVDSTTSCTRSSHSPHAAPSYTHQVLKLQYTVYLFSWNSSDCFRSTGRWRWRKTESKPEAENWPIGRRRAGEATNRRLSSLGRSLPLRTLLLTPSHRCCRVTSTPPPLPVCSSPHSAERYWFYWELPAGTTLQHRRMDTPLFVKK